MKCFQEGKGNSDNEKEKEGANIKTASVKQLCGFEPLKTMLQLLLGG